MVQVICTSKHAQFSPLIGGVKFFASEVGRISEEITEAQAEEFMKTPSFFRIHQGDPVEVGVKRAPRGRPAAAGADKGAVDLQPGF